MTETTTATATTVHSVLPTDLAPAADHALSLAKAHLSEADYNEKLDKTLAELETLNAHNILHYGVYAQEKVSNVADQMLAGIKNKDAGPAGEMLSEMITLLKGFQKEKFDPTQPQSLWDKLLRRAKPIVKFQARYDSVNEQIEYIAANLEKHKETLLHDIRALDKLYEANLDYFYQLEFYIEAGEKKLNQLNETEIPALLQQATDSDDLLAAQRLQDLRALTEDLERRVHDLRLTRQVAMQALPSIRMVQQNDKGLVGKINSTLINTLPLWRQQLAQAITIYRSNEAAKTLQAATDLTNTLLEKNAENLQQANQLARTQIERGVFDVSAVKRANDVLIQTIEESLKISAEAQAMRRDAIKTLSEAESSLKQTLRKAASEAQARDVSDVKTP